MRCAAALNIGKIAPLTLQYRIKAEDKKTSDGARLWPT